MFTTAGFRAARHRFFGRTEIVEVPEATAIEIDDPGQLRAAQALAPLVDPPEPLAARVVVTDFDGVHTDDTAWVDATGTSTCGSAAPTAWASLCSGGPGCPC